MNYLTLVPTIIDVVKTVEKLMPEGGKGAEKLAAVRSLLEGIYGDISDRWPAIESVIALFVRLANSTGLFRRRA